MAQWVLGHSDEALVLANEGLALVRDAPQPFLFARGLPRSDSSIFFGTSRAQPTPNSEKRWHCAANRASLIFTL